MIFIIGFDILGVGGSTKRFQEEINRQGYFKVSQVKVFDNGTSNIREILQLNWMDGKKDE